MNLHVRLPSLLSVAVVAIAACSSAPAKKEPPQPPVKPPTETVVAKPSVKIVVASATIGYDCQRQDPQTAAVPTATSESSVASKPKPKPPSAGKRAPVLADAPVSAGDMPDGLMRQGSRAPMVCEQTAIQLQVTTVGAPTTVALRNVELLDDQGKVLGTLTPRLPLRWDDSASQYIPWDLAVAADTSAKVSWTLSTPVWSELGMTHSEAANRTFRIRVTVGATGGDQVVDGEARVVVISAPTPLPPGAVT